MKQTYKVIGPHNVMDHAPGETFSAELDQVAEQRLLDAGHIKRVKDAGKGTSNGA